jgi:hypothetical protein
METLRFLMGLQVVEEDICVAIKTLSESLQSSSGPGMAKDF